MKKLIIFLSIITLTLGSLSAQLSDSTLRVVLDVINKDSLQKTVQDMQDFGSRLCTKTVGQNRQVAQYLVDRLKSYGVENARIDSFYKTGYNWLVGNYSAYFYNALGTLPGTGESDSTVIIGGHLDAISYNGSYQLTPTAPGADDNATGCAVMIEAARIMHEKKLTAKYNIDFMGYDAEEIGLIGAHYDAQKRKAANEKIVVMLNNDMVGHQPVATTWEVTLHWYNNALDVTEKARQALINYTTVTPFVPNASQNGSSGSSDSYAYAQQNYKATFAIEKTFSPYYHQTSDLVQYLNFEYCKQIARMNFALLADYAVMTIPYDSIPNDTIPEDSIPNDTIPNDSTYLKNWMKNVQIYPNPVHDVLRVHNYSDVIINRIDIYDLQGRLMQSLQEIMEQQNIIRLSNYQRGIYFIKIHTNKGVMNRKFVKQ